MEYKFNLGEWGSVFAVPHSVVERDIKIATGDNLKVLLYCLRYSGQGLSVGEISRATGVAPDNVSSSLEFWGKRIESVPESESESKSEITATPLTNPDNKTATTKLPTSLLERDREFSPSEIADVINSNKGVEQLFKQCEEQYGRPLKHSEQNALAVIVEEIGMKPEVATMLIDFCFSIGKTSADYIKKVAKDWIERGIDTVTSADSEIKHFNEYYSAEGELKRLFDVRAIPDARKPLIKKWLFEQRHSIQTIYEAYQMTLEKIGKLRYNYMDKILSGDSQGGEESKSNKSNPIKTAKSLKKGSAAPSSFDLDELNKKVMEKYNR